MIVHRRPCSVQSRGTATLPSRTPSGVSKLRVLCRKFADDLFAEFLGKVEQLDRLGGGCSLDIIVFDVVSFRPAGVEIGRVILSVVAKGKHY